MNNQELIHLTSHFLIKWQSDHHNNATQLMQPILASLNREDRPKLTATISGIMRKKLLLEELLGRFSSIPQKKIHFRLKVILQVSIYQLLFDKTLPDHAVIHSAISLCIKHHKGFANAILREISRQRGFIQESIIPTLPLSIRFSFPEPFIHFLTTAFPIYPVTDYLEYLNSDPIFHDCVDPKKPEIDQTVRTVHEPILSLSFQSIRNAKTLDKGTLNQHGQFIQNISSQLVSYIAVALRPRRVLDLCSAPGSKSSLMALLNPKLQIVSNDISPSRLHRLANRKKARPESLNQISLACSDGFLPSFSDSFDLLLIDAPCSAMGTVRKNPDRRYNCSPDQIDKMAAQQQLLLKNSLSHYPRAQILYSVCTFSLPETSQLIASIIDQICFDKTALKTAQKKLISLLRQSGLPFQIEGLGAFILPDKQKNPDTFFLALLPAQA